MEKEHRLKVGETAKIKRGFMTSYSVVYAGMVSDRVYSIAVSWSSGHNSASHNLYLDRGQRELPLLGGRIVVLDVNQREIHFQFLK